ncbi:hypothetical protein [Ferrovibrio sp.]|uniref:ribonuclease T2 family protein n=1 Tax=Ferrovibrio sp. TaxID=1917215 RepID=UPI0035B1658A
MLRYFLFPLLLFLALPQPAIGQAQQQCRLPERIESQTCPQTGPRRGMPGDFDYYVLALSWSPHYCASTKRPDPLQCQDNRFGFVAHGLWPQYRSGHTRAVEGGWPQYCAPTRPPPMDLQRQYLCRMPSSRLIACQWAKHGSCGDFGSDETGGAERYLQAIAGAMDKIALPALTPGEVRVGDLLAALRRINPALQPGQAAVVLRDGQLQEVRFCLKRDLSGFTACDKNAGGARENQKLQIR